MATVIAGRFETLQGAEDTAQALLRSHIIGRDNLATFYVGPPGQHHAYPLGGDHAVDPHAGDAHSGSLTGAAIGAGIGLAAFAAGPAAAAIAIGIGAYTGSLLGALKGLNRDASDAIAPENVERQAGVMVAVRIDPSAKAPTASVESAVVDILEQHGAQDIEKASGEVRDGEWIDFEAESLPHRIERAP